MATDAAWSSLEPSAASIMPMYSIPFGKRIAADGRRLPLELRDAVPPCFIFVAPHEQNWVAIDEIKEQGCESNGSAVIGIAFTAFHRIVKMLVRTRSGAPMERR